MSKLVKLLHDAANVMQAIAGHLELADDEKDRARHVAEARKLTGDMFRILRQLRRYLES